ncbi:MAG TPA: glucose 1-dehydrogenase [Candidatus Binatia bacterium]|nr:glucose 1-dehydrogenase [Candidatus Binatia bacterium]
MGKLTGKTAVVTGASKGIGAGIAKAFAKDGANVVVNYARGKADAEKVLAEIQKSGGKAITVQADVSKQADVDRLFETAKKTFGSIDILVNNAGVYEFAPIEQITEESYRRMFDLNVLGTVLSTQAALQSMNGSGGSIINVSSVVSLTPPPATAIYSATKGAVDVITRTLAQELGPRNIRVNSLSPGLVETEGTRAAGTSDGEFKQIAISRTPLGRVGEVDDIAKVAVFLASDDSGWITGEVLPVGGGARL